MMSIHVVGASSCSRPWVAAIRPWRGAPSPARLSPALALLALSFSAAAQEPAFPIAAWSRTEAAAENQGSPTERGRAVFNNWCSACHSRGPANAPGTMSLQFKYRGELPAALEDRTDLTAEQVEFYVRNGIATMPFYRPTELSDADVTVLAAYLVKD